jgi:hemoglobin/transferrin/lactoferrin receptor protein
MNLRSIVHSARLRRRVLNFLVCLPAPLAAAIAQNPQSQSAADSAARLRTITVTATRRETDTRDVALPVVVVDSSRIARLLPNGAADALRGEPGVDLIGVGSNQVRPAIRGQRGQRILLLEDGLRLNNSRRQQDFGEILSLADVDQLDRIEVVRGPSSVLYGTDAIGGVINLISKSPGRGDATWSGRAKYQFGGAGASGKSGFGITTGAGAWSFSADASARMATDYDAPAGSYGNVRLPQETTVQHSGVRDRNLSATLAWKRPGSHEVFARGESYRADDAGFGYVPPSVIGGSQTRVEIMYPRQDFSRITLGLRSASISTVIADRFDVNVYRQDNARDLAQHIFAPFGPGTPPGAGADIITGNHTDITSTGFRAEGTKALSRVILTYGADLFHDHSVNRDSSVTTIVGFGPPQSQKSNRAQVPNATLTSAGLFAQGDLRLHKRLSVVVGVRGQQVRSEPSATEGRTDPLTTHTSPVGVYSVNAVWRANPVISVVATAGRGFRSPNLVERYFDGPTPEGSAYQKAAPDLRPETSFTLDGGFKIRTSRFSAEAALFQNDISDAITIAPTGEKQGTLSVYQNVNVQQLRTKGSEVSVSAALGYGLSAGANHSTVKSTNITSPNSPVGDTYSSKLVGTLGWASPRARLWAEYQARRNGEQKEIAATASPVGPVLPAFTVQNVRAGIRGLRLGAVRGDLTIGVNNIANVLYAEAANASFFRPEPGRHLVAALSTAF